MTPWHNAITSHRIPEIYQDANIENKNIHKKLTANGKKWLALPKKPSLYLAGNPGSGKTFFAYGLFRAIVESGNPWQIFVRGDWLDQEFLNAIKNGQESWAMEKYTEVPYLFIDDFGVERITDRLLRQYYTLLETRLSNNRTTVITSNIERGNIAQNVGDRIASRLEMATQIVFPDKDLRKTIAKQKESEWLN